MFQRSLLNIIVAAMFLISAACQQPVFRSPAVAPSVLRDVPAMRFNYRFEPDVPPPAVENPAAAERNPAVQSDFDQNRPQDILDKTVTSPNNQRVLAVYHNVSDLQSEFRLDMYSPDGKLLKRMTHEGMAVHFADAIVWSPDSSAAAFVAMARLEKPQEPSADSEKKLVPDSTPAPKTEEEAANSNAETPAADQPVVAPTASGGEEPSPILTFRSEQIYLCDANGGDLKPLTQNEGLIYFYLVWAPDSSAIAALASKSNEWKIWKYQADQNGQVFRPAGRPRIVEKNGRQRLLDDYPTQVHPVWSPDSAKVASAFDKQIRIYDAIGNAPTQAAILLRNQLLISSKAYDEAKRQESDDATGVESNGPSNQSVNKPANANTAAANLPAGVLPDETTLVSFNPIVDVRWTEDAMLYLETAFVREFIDSSNNVRSNSRWHRLIFSAQAVALGTQP